MEAFSANLFEDIRYERNLIFFLSLTDLDILKQSKITNDEIILLKKFCS